MVTTTSGAESIPLPDRHPVPFAGGRPATYGHGAMGFLDKLLGRTKDTAGNVADKTQDSTEQVWDKSTDVAGDVADEAKETVSDLTDRDDDASATEPDTTGSTPPAA